MIEYQWQAEKEGERQKRRKEDEECSLRGCCRRDVSPPLFIALAPTYPLYPSHPFDLVLLRPTHHN